MNIQNADKQSTQDADKPGGRGQAFSPVGRHSPQDADKQRPYYGRGLVLLARVSREIGVNDAWCGYVARASREIGVNDAWCGWVAQAPGPVPIPDHQANPALRYAENDITHPTPVHSRDAPCVRPAGSGRKS